MKIIADENIPLVNEFFSHLGEVITLPGRNMTAADVKDADALIVRSVTQVNESLLAGSRVRFVGTCTIGVDHLDRDYLTEQGITFTSAPGCNANSVVEYVFSALCALDQPWQGKTIGIIGCGNVGGHLYRRLRALGVDCRCYDPFLSARDNPDLCSLVDVLQSDIVSLHTPLTRDGDHPTYHLLGLEQLRSLPEQSLLLNCGRGAVIDNQALLQVLGERPDLRVVLDVWEPEPALNPDLLAKVLLGSPHIAGYSFDGKVKGTEMIYSALCQQLKREPQHSITSLLQAPDVEPIMLDQGSDWERVQQAVLSAYDIREDDARLRQIAASPQTLPEAFDALRKHYPQRREFHNLRVSFSADTDEYKSTDKKKPPNKLLAALGFALYSRTEESS